MSDTMTLNNQIEHEKAVLGSLMMGLSSKSLEIPNVYFTQESHRVIFSAIRSLAKAGDPADILTITRSLGPEGLSLVGGAVGVSELTNSVPSTAHFEFYLQALREAYETRSLQAALKIHLRNSSQEVTQVRLK